ncbi:FRG domain-containing protein [Agromyces humi]|uniref:FRG domain-containing protein n=1 Tax=Agromyces humi TaxID=1766800 RepID=UPI00135BDC4A|nr:FRG domain-containing protein [Agromyces humi]
MTELFSVLGRIGGFSARSNLAWRGFASIDYDLVSSLQRVPGLSDEDSLRDVERSSLTAAREWGLGFGHGGWASDLQLLADLQHYGTSTRLMDVTSNPMTALWFACQQPASAGLSRSGLLLAINTTDWPRYGRAQPSGRPSAIDNPIGWELERALGSGSPFVVESLSPNDRLRAQEGFFIADRVPAVDEQAGPFKSLRIAYPRIDSHDLKSALQNPDGSASPTIRDRLPFVAVKVNQGLKRRALKILQNSYNRTHRVLFPDFTGFREYSAHATPRERSSEVNETR